MLRNAAQTSSQSDAERILDASPRGCIRYDATLTIVWMNRAALRLFPSDLTGQSLSAAFPEFSSEELGRRFASPTPQSFELPAARWGTWFQIDTFPVADGQYAAELTDTMPLRTLLESIDQGLIRLDAEYRYTWVNEKAQQILRCPADELIGKSMWQVYPDCLGTEIEVNYRRVMERRESVRFEVPFAAVGGIYRIHIVPDANGGVAVFFQDVTEDRSREAHLARLAESERQSVEEFRTLMNVVPIGIFVAHDAQCHFITGNRMANAVYEASAGENVSATVVDVRRFFREGVEVRPEDLPMQYAAARNVEVENTELEILLPSGRKRNLIARASPLRDEVGQVRGCVGAFLDITDRIAAEQTLQERTEELSRSNDELQSFAYAASHDLQEPLRMIATYTELLIRRHGLGDAQEIQYTTVIREGVRRMQTLIADLLAYSRIAHQETTFTNDVDLTSVVADAVWNLQSAIEESGAVVEYGKLPSVQIDQQQMTQLFQNLLSNAIKYRHPDRAPRIAITAERTGMAWTICVEDNGSGFDMQYADTVFGLFRRLHSQAEIPGTGIGLAVCRRIVGRHGGRIWAESRKDEGTKFLFTLPARA